MVIKCIEEFSKDPRKKKFHLKNRSLIRIFESKFELQISKSKIFLLFLKYNRIGAAYCWAMIFYWRTELLWVNLLDPLYIFVNSVEKFLEVSEKIHFNQKSNLFRIKWFESSLKFTFRNHRFWRKSFFQNLQKFFYGFYHYVQDIKWSAWSSL